LSKLKIKPEELVHVGDNREFDYRSPKKIGIKSIYLNRDKKYRGNHVIYSLSELKNAIYNY